MNQKRFINTIAIIGISVFVGGIGYFIVDQLIHYQNKGILAVPRDIVDSVEMDPLKLKWTEKIQVASGSGFRGPWRMNESEFHYVDDPTVALSKNGIVGVAWVNQSRKDIFFQIYEPGGKPRFSKPTNVSKSPRIFSWLPRVVFGSSDASVVYVLWQEIVFSGGSHGGEIFFARSTDAGRTFGKSINLSNTTAGDGKGRVTLDHWHNGSLDIAIGPEGNIYAAWTEYEGALRFARSTDGGMHFSTPIHIAGGSVAAPARGPSIAVNANGIVYLAWSATEGRVGGIYFAKSVDKGRTFSKPNFLSNSGGHADAPKIALDSKGAIHLVYAKSPAGLFKQYHIRHSSSNDGGRTFRKSKEISRGADIKQSTGASFPMLNLDGKDNLYIIWEIFPYQARRSHGLGFTFSSDGGQTFKPPSLIPNSANPLLGFNGSQQGLLMNKLAVNEAGMIAVVNSTFRANEKSYIWLHLAEAIER